MSTLNCARCSRAMRPHGTLAKDHPGTISTANKEMCWQCYRAALVGREIVPRKPRGTGGASEALLAERARFEADRRKRGIPPEGALYLRKIPA